MLPTEQTNESMAIIRPSAFSIVGKTAGPLWRNNASHQRSALPETQRSRIRQGFLSTASPIHDKGVRQADPSFSILLMVALVIVIAIAVSRSRCIGHPGMNFPFKIFGKKKLIINHTNVISTKKWIISGKTKRRPSKPKNGAEFDHQIGRSEHEREGRNQRRGFLHRAPCCCHRREKQELLVAPSPVAIEQISISCAQMHDLFSLC
jgi:hypothetical protein